MDTQRSPLATYLLCSTLIAGACEPDPEPEGAPARCEHASTPTPAHPRAAAFAEALQDSVDAGLPGIVMAVRDRDGIWQGAAGSADLGRDTDMQTCHRTRIASVTKIFVATAVSMLVEEGRLSLHDTVADLLPELADRLPHADAITVEQLLSHQSGVHNFIDVPLVLELFDRPSRTWTLDECLDHALAGKPEHDPGTAWSYSNTNYVLLGRIIEAITGKPHAVVLRERIFDPLGLDDTSYAPDVFDFSGVVHGYFDVFGDRTFVDSTETFANSCVGPDGGMVSTAEDLRVFVDHLLVERDLLEPSTLEAMLPHVPTGEEDFPSYGFGLEAWGDGAQQGIGHGGQEFGYRTFAYAFPDRGISFVVWVNASSLIPTDDNIAAVIDARRDALRDLVLER